MSNLKLPNQLHDRVIIGKWTCIKWIISSLQTYWPASTWLNTTSVDFFFFAIQFQEIFVTKLFLYVTAKIPWNKNLKDKIQYWIKNYHDQIHDRILSRGTLGGILSLGVLKNLGGCYCYLYKIWVWICPYQFML